MTTPAPPFGVDHVRAACHNVKLPPKVDPDSLLWGFRFCKVDFQSTHDYRWPFPGHWAKAPGPILDHTGECCSEKGDGICAAHTLSGASSNGARVGASVGLLVAWTAADALGASSHKVRLRQAWVAAIFDPVAAIIASGADLTGAYLAGANLTGANLTRAAYTQGTLWPNGFDAAVRGVVLI